MSISCKYQLGNTVTALLVVVGVATNGGKVENTGRDCVGATLATIDDAGADISDEANIPEDAAADDAAEIILDVTEASAADDTPEAMREIEDWDTAIEDVKEGSADIA
ncbi:hypothetical protein INT47_007671 [Mucor saturninus]|uniref:Uncharacterized protein n=1 Tax=Mucor saturninus TaxID=64648 RepID=A0A8H7QP67_9FUNG|nr:hypothetical protein INT47_007671 [Mucor saturninus]